MTANKGEFDTPGARPNNGDVAPEPQPSYGEVAAPPAYESIQADAEPINAPTPAQDPTANLAGAGKAGPTASLRGSKRTTGPTADDPFRFPVDAPLPPYSTLHSSSQAGPSTSAPGRYLIAIPQTQPTPTSPFHPAYAPTLLRHGITQETFLSFLSTLSAFLAAKVSERAVAHAADVAAKVGNGPKSHFKHVFSHTRDVFRDIGKTAKKGDVVGAFGSVISGAITIPVTAAMGTVGAVVSLPGSTVSAVAKKALTQRQRAEMYVTVANKDWFEKRGLVAALVDTAGAAEVVGVGVPYLTEAGQGKGVEGVEGVLGGLGGRVERLEVLEGVEMTGVLEVGPTSLWLVLARVDG
ncbi:uncharacterized protein DNG_09194 [Cephalotrichum gorgonifer]|uniref:Uncharacterized protein n=1 Tax=Cephalotrichum gorgonifer TaxID=2041049 RepID=A0AAE8N6F7_9PEZI|nr:uncharacterized protein DNG_09194 [Cephalotrichum gorgonifer]